MVHQNWDDERAASQHDPTTEKPGGSFHNNGELSPSRHGPSWRFNRPQLPLADTCKVDARVDDSLAKRAPLPYVDASSKQVTAIEGVTLTAESDCNYSRVLAATTGLPGPRPGKDNLHTPQQ